MKPNLHLQDEIYAAVGEEIARKEFHPGPMARAVAESHGNGEWVQGLYIKFRVEELYRRTERDTAAAAKAAAIAARADAKSHFGRDLFLFFATIVVVPLAFAALFALILFFRWLTDAGK